MSNVFAVASLLPYNVSMMVPRSKGGASATNLRVIIVAMVVNRRVVCFLQAVLINVCIGCIRPSVSFLEGSTISNCAICAGAQQVAHFE